jgi:hypothetical protein
VWDVEIVKSESWTEIMNGLWVRRVSLLTLELHSDFDEI